MNRKNNEEKKKEENRTFGYLNCTKNRVIYDDINFELVNENSLLFSFSYESKM